MGIGRDDQPLHATATPRRGIRLANGDPVARQAVDSASKAGIVVGVEADRLQIVGVAFSDDEALRGVVEPPRRRPAEVGGGGQAERGA